MAGWILLLFCFIAAIDKALASSGGSDGGGNADSHLEIYKKLFALKRKEQIQTAEQVWNIRDYAKQYKTIQFLMETLFPVIKESLLSAGRMNYTPGDPFPDEQEKREELGKIYENVLFFGDVLLRMPDITKKIYRKHRKEWQHVLEEAVQFCNGTKALFSGPYATQLHLMAQEIGILPEEDDYINPFRAAEPQTEKNPEPPKKEKKKKKSGPKLRGSNSRFDL